VAGIRRAPNGPNCWKIIDFGKGDTIVHVFPQRPDPDVLMLGRQDVEEIRLNCHGNEAVHWLPAVATLKKAQKCSDAHPPTGTVVQKL
jgi:hypothetical protein